MTILLEVIEELGTTGHALFASWSRDN